MLSHVKETDISTNDRNVPTQSRAGLLSFKNKDKKNQFTNSGIDSKKPKLALSAYKASCQAAFTLVELLVTLCVLSMMMAIAIPSYNTMILNSRLAASSDSLVSSLNFARSSALHNNMNVMVCPIGVANSTTCGNNWGKGWIVVTQPAAGAAPLIKSDAMSAAGPSVLSNVTSVTFTSRGLAGAQSNFSLCDSRGSSFATSVEVMATGFTQSGSTPGQAVWNNSALACP